MVREGMVLDCTTQEMVGVDHGTVRAMGVTEEAHVIAQANGLTYWAVGVDAEVPAPDDHEFRDLYTMHAVADPTEWALAGRAVQLVEWGRTHRYCGRCATPTQASDGDRSRTCPACGLVAYPRLAPAVITLIHRGDEAILARGTRFRSPMFSTLAGFVEPGESVEHALRREVFEEVGVRVGRVEYFGSQPWPFPNSLMLGFLAEYASGDIEPDPTEIAEAGWYRYDALPAIPPPISIAHRLIMEWVRRRTDEPSG